MYIVGGNMFGNEEGEIHECKFVDVEGLKKIIQKWHNINKVVYGEIDYEDLVYYFSDQHFVFDVSKQVVGKKMRAMSFESLLEIVS